MEWEKGEILCNGELFKTGGGQGGNSNPKPLTEKRRYIWLVKHGNSSKDSSKVHYVLYYTASESAKKAKGSVEITKQSKLRKCWFDYYERANAQTTKMRLMNKNRTIFLRALNSQSAQSGFAS